MLRNSIKKLVAENKTDEVIDALLGLSDKIEDEGIKNSVIILSSRYKRFVDQNIRGISDAGEENVFLAQLNDAVLKLIDEMPEAYFTENNKTKKEPAPANALDETLTKVIKISVLVLFLFSLVSLIGSMVYYSLFYVKDPAMGNDLRFGNFIPFWTSLTGVATSGFFYFAHKVIK